MDVTVREHIVNLGARIKALANELMDEKNLSKRNMVESEIRAAEVALVHYRAAIDLESTFDNGPSRYKPFFLDANWPAPTIPFQATLLLFASPRWR